MFKKFTALLITIAIAVTFIPMAYADTYNNIAYKGTYLSAGATDTNYGKLVIHTIDETDVSVDFEFIKNGNQQLFYTCEPGKMNGDSGTLRFTVRYADGSFVSNGTMKITLDEWCVRISCDSDQGQHLFDGMMKPEFQLNPHPSTPPGGGDPGNSNTPPAPTNAPETTEPVIYGDVSVEINGEAVEFTDVEPVIINDRTYVPLRSVFGLMGINVYWDDYKKNDILNAQSITCTKNDIIVQFSRTYNETGNNVWTLNKWVGVDTSSKDFTRINITDLQPTIIDNRSYVPLRVVSEAFDADVMWVHDQRLVQIECDTYNEFNYDADTIAAIEDYSLEAAKTYLTDDYKNVIDNTTPYFSPQAKFYRFNAEDTWNTVTLYVIYGGFIEVYSGDYKPVAPPVEDIVTPAPEVTEIPLPEPTEEPIPLPQPIPTDAPATEATEQPIIE